MTDNQATELLRKLLDENGIEWKSGRTNENNTSWNVGDLRVTAKELSDGTLLMQQYSRKHLTPEQAIAATLGSVECEMEHDGEIVATALKLSVWFCSECGSPTYNDMKPFYCQYCGAKVVDR